MTASNSLPAVEHKHAEINGTQMHYVEAGKGRLIVFPQKARACV